MLQATSRRVTTLSRLADRILRRLLLVPALILIAVSTVSAATVDVSVDWGKNLRTVNPTSYGVNCPACFDPAWTHNPDLLKSLLHVTHDGESLVRLHGWGMIEQGSNECWLNADNTWNAVKIKEALTPLIAAGYKLLIDIPSGPGGEKNVEEVRNPQAMAAFAAALVKIVNIDNKFDVRYWEIPNEREKILTPVQMSALLTDTSIAVKKVDPSAMVGGPAAEGINVSYITEVVEHTFPHIDFVSGHTYGGDGKQSDETSYASATKAIADVHTLRTRLNEITKGKYLPIFIDEYNIGWDHTEKSALNEGAVYFSILQSGVVDAGGDVSAVWDFSPPHDMSIVERNGDLHASANLFPLMNQYFYGRQVFTNSSDPGKVRAYAVTQGSMHSLLLSNLGDTPERVDLRFAHWKTGSMTQYHISAAGYQGPEAVQWSILRSGAWILPPKSVAVLVAL